MAKQHGKREERNAPIDPRPEDGEPAAPRVMAQEFYSEIGSVGEPDIIEDDYVGPDGFMRPVQSPSEVREEHDAGLDELRRHSQNIQESEQ